MPSGSTIVGHREQIESLMQDLASGNVAHAYLFVGPPHIGKFTIAKWFAEELLAFGTTGEERERIGEEVKRLIHPDLLVIDQLWMEDRMEDLDVIAETSNIPQHHRKVAKAKTDTISIEDIRALQQRMYEVGRGAFRCCLIRSMERMQPEAVNALLKMLEEPPQGVVFILTTESLSSLLPTLVSRVRALRLSRVAHRELLTLLSGEPEDDAQFILRLAQGAPGMIVWLRNDPDRLREERIQYGKAVNFWRSHSLAERLSMLSPLHERGTESDRFLLHLALALRESITTQPHAHTQALARLVGGLDTNAQRQLMAQQFALAVSGN